jgi:sugar/nucleoside kinase (ribokinase family)
MQNHRFEVLGLGNAIVDVLAQVEESIIEELGLVKGTMALIDEERAEMLTKRLDAAALIRSGGSAGNTIAGVASLGGRAAFVGRVADDALGHAFTREIREIGVEYRTSPASDGLPTARCIVLITPDAQRTMNTFLGASTELRAGDVDEALVADAFVTYLEGYLWDRPEAKEAFVHAAELAHKHGRKVALTLSDPFCVERHRESFLELVDGHIDVLFANEHEIMHLYQTSSFEDALEAVRGKCEIAVLTQSEKGAHIIRGDEQVRVLAKPVERVVDTTGAGDLFAAGFLFGLARGASLEECGRIAAIAAAEVISHIGPRPEVALRTLI